MPKGRKRTSDLALSPICHYRSPQITAVSSPKIMASTSVSTTPVKNANNSFSSPSKIVVVYDDDEVVSHIEDSPKLRQKEPLSGKKRSSPNAKAKNAGVKTSKASPKKFDCVRNISDYFVRSPPPPPQGSTASVVTSSVVHQSSYHEEDDEVSSSSSSGSTLISNSSENGGNDSGKENDGDNRFEANAVAGMRNRSRQKSGGGSGDQSNSTNNTNTAKEGLLKGCNSLLMVQQRVRSPMQKQNPDQQPSTNKQQPPSTTTTAASVEQRVTRSRSTTKKTATKKSTTTAAATNKNSTSSPSRSTKVKSSNKNATATTTNVLKQQNKVGPLTVDTANVTIPSSAPTTFLRTPPPAKDSARCSSNAASPTKFPFSSPPKSPPTPHKIQFLGHNERKTSVASSSSSSSSSGSSISDLKPAEKNSSKKNEIISAKDLEEQLKAADLGPSSGDGLRRKSPARAAKSAATAVNAIIADNYSKTGPKTTSKKAKAAMAAALSSHKVTEYFPIRRSGRKCKATIEKEYLAEIEHHLLADTDEDLPLRVVAFPEKGRGVVAGKSFSKGEFVVEYSGDLVDTGAAKERENQYSLDVSTGCYMYYFKHKGKQYCIDATSESGRLGRLVNHSRLRPNLQTKVVMFKETPRLILVAREDVAEGTELLYDYGDRSKESLQAHPWLSL